MFTDLKIGAWALDGMLFTPLLARASSRKMALPGSIPEKCYVDRSCGHTIKISKASESTSIVLLLDSRHLKAWSISSRISSALPWLPQPHSSSVSLWKA